MPCSTGHLLLAACVFLALAPMSPCSQDVDQILTDAALAAQSPNPLSVFLRKSGEKGCCELALVAETEEGKRKIETIKKKQSMRELVGGAKLCCKRRLCRYCVLYVCVRMVCVCMCVRVCMHVYMILCV
jgi:hypothetical protein